jgi:hypothetical protein
VYGRGDEDWPTGGARRRGDERGAWSPGSGREPRTGHGASAPPGGADGGREDAWVPRSRGSAGGSARAAGRQDHADYARPGFEPEPVAPSRRGVSFVFVALLLLVLPLLGALGSGGSLGVVFAVSCVAAALGGSLLSTGPGLWWIVPCTPIALLAVVLGWASTAGAGTAGTTAAAATGFFNDIAGAFPGVAAGTLVALAVALIRVTRGADSRWGTRG